MTVRGCLNLLQLLEVKDIERANVRRRNGATAETIDVGRCVLRPWILLCVRRVPSLAMNECNGVTV